MTNSGRIDAEDEILKLYPPADSHRPGWRALIALAVLLVSCDVYCAHPLLTEDTPTQGAGKWELELGNTWSRHAGVHTFEFGPQLSYGLLETLDLIARPTLLDIRVNDGDTMRARGVGDTTLDVKWRFLEAGAASVALLAGVAVPTGNVARGLGTGNATAHGLVAATYVAAPLAFHANVGYAQNRAESERRNLYHASAAAVWSLSPRFRLLLADVALDTEPNAGRGRWQSALRVGAIGVVRSGFDVDVGYQVRLNRNGPTSVWLAGATMRW